MDMTMLSVKEFHDALGHETPEKPVELKLDGGEKGDLDYLANELEALARQAHTAATLMKSAPLLRCQLMIEELGEFVRAMEQNDMVECLDALCDMRYVNDGAALSLGLGPVFLAAFREVHSSNMTKFDGDGKAITDAAGRLVKGPDFRPPDLASILRGVES